MYVASKVLLNQGKYRVWIGSKQRVMLVAGGVSLSKAPIFKYEALVLTTIHRSYIHTNPVIDWLIDLVPQPLKNEAKLTYDGKKLMYKQWASLVEIKVYREYTMSNELYIGAHKMLFA